MRRVAAAAQSVDAAEDRVRRLVEGLPPKRESEERDDGLDGARAIIEAVRRMELREVQDSERRRIKTVREVGVGEGGVVDVGEDVSGEPALEGEECEPEYSKGQDSNLLPIGVTPELARALQLHVRRVRRHSEVAEASLLNSGYTVASIVEIMANDFIGEMVDSCIGDVDKGLREGAERIFLNL